MSEQRALPSSFASVRVMSDTKDAGLNRIVGDQLCRKKLREGGIPRHRLERTAY